MVCAPPNACEGRRKADWTAWVVLPLASLRTPDHTAIVCPCALAARSIPASMKWLVVPIWRIGPQWPEVPRARARIVSGPVIDAGRPLAVPLCTHATITSPRPLTATAGRATMNRPSETRTGEPHGLPGRFTAARTAPPLAQVTAAVPSAPIASWNWTSLLLATVVGVPHVAAPADAGSIAATDRATTRRRWRRTVTTRNPDAAQGYGSAAYGASRNDSAAQAFDILGLGRPHSHVHDQLSREAIVGSPDMTPSTGKPQGSNERFPPPPSARVGRTLSLLAHLRYARAKSLAARQRAGHASRAQRAPCLHHRARARRTTPKGASRVGRGSLVVSGAGRASTPRRAVALRQQR